MTTDTPAPESKKPRNWRLPKPDPRRVMLRLSAGMVFGVAAYTSYIHQRAFAGDHGSTSGAANFWPLSADGVLILASLAYNDDRTRHGKAGWESKLGFIVGFLVSLIANLATATYDDPASWLVSGWPAVALLLAVEMLIRPDEPRTRRPRKRPAARPQPTPGKPAVRTASTSPADRTAPPHGPRHRAPQAAGHAVDDDTQPMRRAVAGPQASARTPHGARPQPTATPDRKTYDSEELAAFRNKIETYMWAELTQDPDWTPDIDQLMVDNASWGMSLRWYQARRTAAAKKAGLIPA